MLATISFLGIGVAAFVVSKTSEASRLHSLTVGFRFLCINLLVATPFEYWRRKEEMRRNEATLQRVLKEEIEKGWPWYVSGEQS